MVQYPFFSHENTTSTAGVNVFGPAGRGIVTDGNESEVAVWWPFPASKWKAFNVKIRVVVPNGTMTVIRRVNEVDKGVALTFTNADGVGTIKTDGTEVDVEKGDRIGIRWVSTSGSSPRPIFHQFSYIEFADGLFGY